MTPEQKLKVQNLKSEVQKTRDEIKRKEKEIKLKNYDGDDKVVWVGEIYDEMCKESFKPKKINSGFTFLDKILGGFEEGELITIGGYSNSGKTPLMMNFISNFTNNEEVQCLFFTFENPIKNLIQRYNPETNPNILNFFTPKSNVENNFEWIYDRVLESKLKHKTTVVFIDHLDFIVECRAGDNEERAIRETMRKIKFNLAVQENLIVFLAAHVKKPQDAKKMQYPPEMTDFKGSSAIENYSDMVLMIHKVPDSNGDKRLMDENGEYMFNQHKSAVYNRKSRRMGSGGFVKLIHDVNTKTFKEVDQIHDY